MLFISTNSDEFPFKEASKLWYENKKYFLPLDISFEKLSKGLKGNLWACFEDNKFLGFIYFELKENKWFLSGVACRKMYKYIPICINRLCEKYFNDWNIDKIFSETEYLHAKLALKRSGFIEVKNNLFVKEKLCFGKMK